MAKRDDPIVFFNNHLVLLLLPFVISFYVVGFYIISIHEFSYMSPL